MRLVKKSRSFSLFEILITVLLLSALIVTSYLAIPKLIEKAYDARRKADLNKIKTNLEIYYDFAKEFPATLPDCGQPLFYRTQILISSFPCDPVTKLPYYYQTKSGNTQSFRLYAILANSQDVSIAKVGCLGGCGSDCNYNYGVSSTNIGLVQCSYVCSPSKRCIMYNDPTRSDCPKLYYNDPTCNNECSIPANRCHDESGKNIPY
jgi:Tfp pilus assembly protein PilE